MENEGVPEMKKGRPFGRRDFKTEEERQAAFWERVAIGGLDECWNWTGYREKETGYGKFFFNKRLNGSHRYAYMVARGPIPDGMLICHRCDNRLCQNPTHLFVGTHADNNLDMTLKGRRRFVKPPLKSRITEDDVRQIRSMWVFRKVTAKDIATKLQLPIRSVQHALEKGYWKHVA